MKCENDKIFVVTKSAWKLANTTVYDDELFKLFRQLSICKSYKLINYKTSKRTTTALRLDVK